jgi:hypothetical protein
VISTGLKGGVSPETLVGRLGALGLHTLAVYVCAVHLSPWLVGRWFAWGARILQISATTLPADWYLQHLELASIVPAVLLGYIAARQSGSVATWAWGIPTLVLAYGMLRYHAPSSVLFGSSMSAVRYYFDIEHTMPTMMNPTASDPVRVLAQMTVTASFYSGVAYSLGAWSAKRQLIPKLFGFAKPQP